MFGHVLEAPVLPASFTALLTQLGYVQAAVDAGTMAADGVAPIGVAVLAALGGQLPAYRAQWNACRAYNGRLAAGTINADDYLAALVRLLSDPLRVITEADLRTYLRLPANTDGSLDDEDEMLRGLIDAATQYVQDLTGRQLLTATWQLVMSAFPGTWMAWAPPNVPVPQVQGMPLGWPIGSQFPDSMEIELPYPPLRAVSLIEYTDTTGTLQTLASNMYQVDNTTLLGRVAPAYGQVWPVAQLEYQSVVITYTCGYGSATEVPADLVRALKALIGLYYANREAVAQTTGVGNLIDVPHAITAILRKYQVRGPQ